MPNPTLPREIRQFSEGSINPKVQPKSLKQYEALHAIELRDVDQQITMRPYVAVFFGMLLLGQVWIVFYLVMWSLRNNKLYDLQLIFAVLIAGTLTQNYKISELIVNKLFEPIDYTDKHNRFKGVK